MLLRPVQASEWREYRTIRLAALRDSPTAFARSYAEEATFGDEIWQARAQAAEEAERRTMIVATDGNGRWLGLAGGYRPGEGVDTEIVSLWVDPAARHQGLGRRLVDAVVSWAAGHDDRTIGLWVNERNHAAIELYARAGFTPTGAAQPLPSDPCQTEIRMVLRRG